MAEDLLTVGVVTGTHGVGGELKVKSYSGLSDHILLLREALFRKGREEKRLRLDSVRPQPPGVILKITGIESPEQARRFVGWEIWVPRPQAARLLDGEYYAADLCLCSLWFGEEEIGSVRSVWEGGPRSSSRCRASRDGPSWCPSSITLLETWSWRRGKSF